GGLEPGGIAPVSERPPVGKLLAVVSGHHENRLPIERERAQRVGDETDVVVQRGDAAFVESTDLPGFTLQAGRARHARVRKGGVLVGALVAGMRARPVVGTGAAMA